MKSGTIVKLKSGGPRMTVEGPGMSLQAVRCTWFDGTELRRSEFHEDQLETEGPIGDEPAPEQRETVREAAQRGFRGP
jgi:uncharacterized protein YodC (DUF2158 family)